MIIGNYYIKFLIQKVTDLDKVYNWYTLLYPTNEVACVRNGEYETWLAYVKDYNFPRTAVSWIFVCDYFLVFDDKEKLLGIVGIQSSKNFRNFTYSKWKKERKNYLTLK